MTKKKSKDSFPKYQHLNNLKQPLHEALGIETCVYRVPILALTRSPSARMSWWDPVNRVSSKDHLFRASITLARV